MKNPRPFAVYVIMGSALIVIILNGLRMAFPSLGSSLDSWGQWLMGLLVLLNLYALNQEQKRSGSKQVRYILIFSVIVIIILMIIMYFRESQ